MKNIGKPSHYWVKVGLPMNYLQESEELVLAQVMSNDFFYLLLCELFIGIVMLVVLNKLVLN